MSESLACLPPPTSRLLVEGRNRFLLSASMNAGPGQSGESAPQSSFDAAEVELHRFQSELQAQNEELQDVQTRLEASLQLHLQLFEDSPVAMGILSDEAWVDRMNHSARRLFGLGSQQIRRGPLVAWLEPRHHSRLFELLRTVRERNAQGEAEVQVKGRSGPRTVRLLVDAFDPSSYIVALIDITEIREVERARRDTESRYQRLFNASRDALLVFNAETSEILEANPAAAELLGSDGPEYLLTRKLIDFIPPGQEGAWKSLIKGRCGSADSVTVQLTMHRATEEVLTEVRIGQVEEDGSTLLASFRDVEHVRSLMAERTALEDRLGQVEKMDALGTLAGGIAHDMNNMLTAVRVSASCLVSELSEGAAGREDAEAILTACTRFSKLVGNLLGFAKHRPKDEMALVSEAVSEVVSLTESRIRRSDVKLTSEYQFPNLAVRAPTSLVTQSVMNLVLNALDELPPLPTSEIKVKVTRHHREEINVPEDVDGVQFVRITVSDNGPGMVPEVAARAFDPFFTTKPQGKGTGLGLAVVYRNTRQVGGWTEIDSFPGRGTSVHLYIPRSVPTIQLREGDQSQATSAPLKKILVVEDEALVAKSVCRFLRRAGFEVDHAENGRIGLEKYRQFEPSVVLMDVVMPEMDGPTCAVELRKSSPELPILFYSAHLRSHGLSDLKLDERTELLEKPFEFAELRKRLHRLLEHASAVKAPAELPSSIPS